MSTYKKITRHPNTGVYDNATWHDDYFGHHMYGVEFPGDKVVYPYEQVEKAQLKEFWADDVINAMRTWIDKTPSDRGLLPEIKTDLVLEFLKELNKTYKQRWTDHPLDGDGAVDNLRAKKSA